MFAGLPHRWRELWRSRMVQCFLVSGLLRLCPAVAVGQAKGDLASEHEVKAAFLCNIAKYAEWPEESLPPGSPIVIGILGTDPFGPAIDRIVEGRRINGRAVVLRRAPRLNDLKQAHIIFISASERDRAPQICSVAEVWSAVTVGDTTQTEPFAAINFDVERGRIVFTVNLDAARRAETRISSKLLNLAKAVRGSGRQGVVGR